MFLQVSRGSRYVSRADQQSPTPYLSPSFQSSNDASDLAQRQSLGQRLDQKALRVDSNMTWPKAVIRLTAIFPLFLLGSILSPTSYFSHRLPPVGSDSDSDSGSGSSGSGDHDTATSDTEF